MSDQTPKWMTANVSAEITGLRSQVATLTARCEALEKKPDEDSAAAALDAFDEGQIAAAQGKPKTANPYWEGDSWGVPHTRQMWDDGYDLMEVKALRLRCEALTADRDQLLAGSRMLAQERDHALSTLEQLRASKRDDDERFGRDLKTFAAGYTQALDDALKGKP